MTDPANASPRIEEKEDGPILVHNATGMIGTDGKPVEIKETMSLCRCGRSSTKPFCDGTHRKTGFKSRTENEPSGKDKLRSYEGSDQTVLYNARLCSHAAQCVKLAPEAFTTGEAPWIKPDKAEDTKLPAVIRACPSGALQMEDQGHLIPDRVTVHVEKDGPYWITGAWIDAPLDAKGATKDKYVLCRCGLSGMKPFCDGTHHNEKWSDDD
ncbi:CDGSH iron-sulfur domain-containing protein [Aestuariibius insulae]|uniref:CDGSH iron-sulfur domain-containing protein n=1 Tax=Aestuariibius insulae TaxID=2058287 RepID=UPI00345E5C84